MKSKVFTRFVLLTILGSILLCASCKTRKKDCRGRKKQVKTDMGGWL